MWLTNRTSPGNPNQACPCDYCATQWTAWEADERAAMEAYMDDMDIDGVWWVEREHALALIATGCARRGIPY